MGRSAGCSIGLWLPGLGFDGGDGLKKVCDLFDDDIYNAVNLINCLNGRKVAGGPAPEQVKNQLEVINCSKGDRKI